MRNLPIIYQYFVTQTLSPVQQKYPRSMILHYIGNLLITAPSQTKIKQTGASVVTKIQTTNLQISITKIQKVSP